MLDDEIEEMVEKVHKIDSLNLLIYIGLLILMVLTVWLFKYKRLSFVHETSLCILYGVITGLIFTLLDTSKPDFLNVTPYPPNMSQSNLANKPADVLQMKVCKRNGIHTFNCTDEDEFSYSLLYTFSAGVHSANDSSAIATSQESAKAVFDPEIFFNILLPPIIFHAGYSMKKRHFFRNFGAVLAYAFVGTGISAFVVGGVMFGLTRLMTGVFDVFDMSDSFFFGAIISATDPVTVLAIFQDLNVDTDLFALVFGESVLNDAVAIVLSGTIESYADSGSSSSKGLAVFWAFLSFLGIFAGAFAIGSLMGCVTAIMTKFTKIHEFPLLETSLFFLMSYSTFLAAEAAGMTGIVAVLFCGITQAHYTYNNLSKESKHRTRELFQLLNFLAENFVFLYIGVSIFTFKRHKWDAGFIFSSFFAILLGRALNIYVLSFLLNLGRKNKIGINLQHMMMFAGLRGAIAFALSIRNTSTANRQLMFSTTLIIVIVTLLVGGCASMKMLSFLNIRVGVEDEKETNDIGKNIAKARHYQSVVGSNATSSNHSRQSSSAGGGGGHSPVDHLQTGFESYSSTDMTTASDKAWLVMKYYNIDNKYIKPFLTHSRPTLMDTLPEGGCCGWLARILTTDQQLIQGSPHRRYEQDDTDLIIDATNVYQGATDDSSFSNPLSATASAAQGDTAATADPSQPATLQSPTHSRSRPSQLVVENDVTILGGGGDLGGGSSGAISNDNSTVRRILGPPSSEHVMGSVV